MVYTPFFINVIMILDVLNTQRMMYCVPNVTWSNIVQQSAQEWSNALASQNVFFHSNTDYGENIALIWDEQPSNIDKTFAAVSAMNSFYSEWSLYDYNKPGFSMQTGHWTQNIWRSTREIGVGIAKNTIGNLVVTVQFNPHGNVQGQYTYNVPKPCNYVMPLFTPLKNPPLPPRNNRRKRKSPSPPPPKKRKYQPKRNLI